MRETAECKNGLGKCQVMHIHARSCNSPEDQHRTKSRDPNSNAFRVGAFKSIDPVFFGSGYFNRPNGCIDALFPLTFIVPRLNRLFSNPYKQRSDCEQEEDDDERTEIRSIWWECDRPARKIGAFAHVSSLPNRGRSNSGGAVVYC